MSTLSVPLPVHMEEYIERMVRRGYASTKADLVRRAITRLMEEEAIQAVLQAEQEVREGKMVKGDLRKILKKMP